MSVESGSGLAVVLAFAGAGTLLLVGLAAAAFVRRRSRSYLFVLLALGTLLVRTVIGALMISGFVALAPHHIIEHTLDFALVGFLLVAIVFARTTRSPARITAISDDE